MKKMKKWCNDNKWYIKEFWFEYLTLATVTMTAILKVIVLICCN